MDSALIVAIVGVAVAVLGTIAAIAAAVYARPSWKASRAKPDLRLIVEPGPRTSAQFYVRLVNKGVAPATDWIAVFTMERGSRFSSFDLRTFEGWSEREAPEGWVATWMAQGSDDSIGPDLYRQVLVASMARQPFHAAYSLKAAGMKERTGQIDVEIGPAPDRGQTIRVT